MADEVGGGEIPTRLGTSPESATRLSRKAAEAEAVMGIHGVSVTAARERRDCSRAWRDAVERHFRVHDTPTRRDPLHRTVELPKPINHDVARMFNVLFGRIEEMNRDVSLV